MLSRPYQHYLTEARSIYGIVHLGHALELLDASDGTFQGARTLARSLVLHAPRPASLKWLSYRDAASSGTTMFFEVSTGIASWYHSAHLQHSAPAAVKVFRPAVTTECSLYSFSDNTKKDRMLSRYLP
jgi:hypothetical protein